jgi:hypothetical protein
MEPKLQVGPCISPREELDKRVMPKQRTDQSSPNPGFNEEIPSDGAKGDTKLVPFVTATEPGLSFKDHGIRKQHRSGTLPIRAWSTPYRSPVDVFDTTQIRDSPQFTWGVREP